MNKNNLHVANFDCIDETEVLSNEMMNEIEGARDSCKSCTLSCKKGGSEKFTDNKEVEISPTLSVKPELL